MKVKPTHKPTAATVARILKALPKSADGQHLYPGMRGYAVSPAGRPFKCAVQMVWQHGTVTAKELVPLGAFSFHWYAKDFFSTRGAALAEVERRNGGKR